MNALLLIARAVLPALPVLVLLLLPATHDPWVLMAMCILAPCVVLAHELTGILCRQQIAGFAQFIRLCGAATVASIGWSGLTATQSVAEFTGAVPLMVVLALVAGSPSTTAPGWHAVLGGPLLIALLAGVIALIIHALPDVQPVVFFIVTCCLVAATLHAPVSSAKNRTPLGHSGHDASAAPADTNTSDAAS